VVPMLIGYIHDKTENSKYYGYDSVGYAYLSISVLNLVFIIFIIILNFKQGDKLNKINDPKEK